MIEETYSAGLISQAFWFIEMKKIIKLLDDGRTEQEIKKLCAVKDKKKIITPPILDAALQRYLEATGDGSIVKAITGVK